MNEFGTRKNDLIIVFYFLFTFIFLALHNFFIGVPAIFLGLVLIKKIENNIPKQRNDSIKVIYAGFWLRLGSQIIDMGAYSLFAWLIILIFKKSALSSLADQVIYIVYLLPVFFMLKTYGQSPGKMVMGIKIVRIDLNEIGWKEVFFRNWPDIFFWFFWFTKYLLLYLGAITFEMIYSNSDQPSTWVSYFKIITEYFSDLSSIWLFSELIILLTNKRKRALHDYLAGTIVIVEEKNNQISKFSNLAVLGSALFLAVYLWFSFSYPFEKDRVRAESGDPVYECSLGSDYFHGRGIQKSYSDAFFWFQKAAIKNNRSAQEYLGIMYENGYYVKNDKTEAVKWYTLSWKNGDHRSKKALKRLGAEIE